MTVERIWPPRTVKKAETAPPAFELPARTTETRGQSDEDVLQKSLGVIPRALPMSITSSALTRRCPRSIALALALRPGQGRTSRVGCQHSSTIRGRARLALLAFEQLTQHRCPAVLSDSPWPLDPRRIVSNMLNVTTCQLGDPITLVVQVKPCDRLLHRTQSSSFPCTPAIDSRACRTARRSMEPDASLGKVR